jgi:hypothetical protein
MSQQKVVKKKGIARRARNAHGHTIRFNAMTAHCLCEVNEDVWIGSDQRILIWCSNVSNLY